MEKYNPQEIEKKWQEFWEKHPELYSAKEEDGEKAYILDMFPYPSADGLHAGHVESYTATDIISRYLRMKGKNVLHPQGWDAFGLPAENFAVKTKTHPLITTQRAIANFKKQMNMMGLSYDWSREVNSSGSDYYKWTQWFFLLLYKNGLAYKGKAKVNWCPNCQTVLANEQAEGGVCDRCGTQVVQKDLEQWFFKITDFIESSLAKASEGQGRKTSGLLDGLDNIDWPEHTKAAQRNWIGKSEGSQFRMQVKGAGKLNAKYDKVLLATNNLSKKERVEKLLDSAGLKIEILLPKDLGIAEQSAGEESDLYENAKEKALLYKDKTDLPVLGLDTGFFIKGEIIDPVKVKRNALAGKSEKDLTQKEIAELLLNYYRNIATKNGGEIEAYWQDVTVLGLPDGRIETAGDKREVILTDKAVGKVDIYFPVRSLYKTKITGKYTAEENNDEHLLGLKPFTDSLIKLLADQSSEDSLRVFTTRLDTVFGMTFALIAPEHDIIQKLKPQIENWEEVEKYIEQAKKKSELQRMTEEKEKTGVELKGIKIVNPFTKKEIPLFASDFVLAHYGTGAVMAVPGHDYRDYDFAKKFGLPIVEVIKSKGGQSSIEKEAFVEDGVLSNSREYDHMASDEAREKMTQWLEKENIGKKTINYKIRDWLISRQRYWGAPIPIIYCDKCGSSGSPQVIPVPEKDLPVQLPDDVDFMPTGESPLARSKKFQDVKCPKCGAPARRESDTMDTFVCSSWYYFRYADPHNEKEFASKGQIKKWLPVNLYVGGAEHTVLHLLYSRFFTKVLHNLGYIDFDEPFLKLRHQGIILAEDGQKMSKSLGNVINPDDVVAQYGADALRMFEMFMGPLEDMKKWDTKGIIGIYRFLEKTRDFLRVYIGIFISEKEKEDWIEGEGEISKIKTPQKIKSLLHKSIKKVTEDIENLKFNTAISQLMILRNSFYELKEEWRIFSKSRGEVIEGRIIERADFEKFILLLSPFAPHISEEIWQEELKHNNSIFTEKWPEYDKDLVKDEIIELVIQINGKLRDKIYVPADISEEEAKSQALASEKIRSALGDKELKKTIFVKGRLINIVI
ncbi:MAG: leucine--tRNA ligase [bacterium]